MTTVWFCILWDSEGEYSLVDDYAYTSEAAAEERAKELNARDGHENTNSGKEWHWDTSRLEVVGPWRS